MGKLNSIQGMNTSKYTKASTLMKPCILALNFGLAKLDVSVENQAQPSATCEHTL